MSIAARTSAAMTVAAIAGATVLANPVPFERTPGTAPVSAAVDLTAASTDLTPWPPLPAPAGGHTVSDGVPVTSTAVRAEDLASVADQIDASYLDYRYADRTRSTAFANQLGYLGKQLYVGYNLIESIVASSVFNGSDILRGEGVLQNIGQFAGDVLLAGLFVAIDEASLASPDTFPIAITRPPLDRPAEWDDADAPRRDTPLSVPTRFAPNSQTAVSPDAGVVVTPDGGVVAAAPDGSTPFADSIDNAFIDGTVAFRTVVTPALNLLGFVGKQLYIGLNFTESLLASAVFNTTSALRGEGILRSLAIFGSDIGRAALFVAIDEAAIRLDPTPIAIDRAPQSAPARWSEPDPPFKGVPLTVPDRSREDATVASTATQQAAGPSEAATQDTSAPDNAAPAGAKPDSAAPGNATPEETGAADSGSATPKRGLLAQWKAKRAENAQKASKKAAADTANAGTEAADEKRGRDAGTGTAGDTASSSRQSDSGASGSGGASGSDGASGSGGE